MYSLPAMADTPSMCGTHMPGGKQTLVTAINLSTKDRPVNKRTERNHECRKMMTRQYGGFLVSPITARKPPVIFVGICSMLD